ncbi:MAG: preprotein translocase subunit SecE [Thermoguttaceae bacterium]
MGTFFQELVRTGIYKRTQGRITRQATFAALVLAIALGLWRLSVIMTSAGSAYQFGLPGGLLLVTLWVCFRVVNLPAFADFLIAVEAEMNKVSWPTRHELFRASLVVLVLIFSLAIVLFGLDAFWGFLVRLTVL